MFCITEEWGFKGKNYFTGEWIYGKYISKNDMSYIAYSYSGASVKVDNDGRLKR